MSILSDAALKMAISQIGKQEIPRGSNWGKDVQGYLNAVGLNIPSSWCMAFIYWCFDKASIKTSQPNTAVKSGHVLHCWNNAKVEQKKAVPAIGAVFVMDLGGGLGHTGIVERFDENYIYTVEGNTNDTGSREGYEVCRRVRPRKKIKGYLYY